MPNIRQYDNPVNGLQVDERGVDAALQVARRGGSFFNQAADAVNQVGSATNAVGEAGARMIEGDIRAAGGVALDYMQHREISQGAAAYAKLNDQLTQKWNDTAKSADPNDPTVAQQFREQVLEPTLQNFGESFLTEGGQKWAEARVESLRGHMFEKTAADMGTLAAQAVAVNVRTMSNTMSNTAMMDPSSVPHLLDGIEGTVGAMVDSSPNLKGADAAKARLALTERMREDIVKSGAIGAIQKAANPEAEAQRWGEKYPQYISGADLKTLSANARQQIRADRMDRAYSDMLAKKDAEARSDATETSYLQKLYSDDPKQQSEVSAKAIVNDPTLTRVAKERMVGVVNREMKPETAAAESNRNYLNILDDIRTGKTNDVESIYKARIDGKINRADFNQALKDFTDFRSPEGQRVGQAEDQFLAAVKPLIDKSNPLMGKVDQDGALNVYRLRMDMKKKIEEYRATGKDWRNLFDPSKPDFMGKPEALTQYQKPLAQSLQDQARKLTAQPQAAPPPARKPGETPAQYLKRTGG